MIALVLTLLGCGEPVGCTAMGCAGQLVVQVVGPPDLSGLVGHLEVDGVRLPVDCDHPEGTEVACEGLTLEVIHQGEPGPVAWSLSTPGDDTAGGWAGEGTVSPDWSSFSPNGPACGPTCYGAEVEVVLQPGP